MVSEPMGTPEAYLSAPPATDGTDRWDCVVDALVADGFTPIEAGEWGRFARRGSSMHTAIVARRFRDAGFSAAEAVRWVHYGWYSEIVALEWARAGWSPDQAAAITYDPQTGEYLPRHEWDTWLQTNIAPERCALFIWAGVGPDDAHRMEQESPVDEDWLHRQATSRMGLDREPYWGVSEIGVESSDSDGADPDDICTV